MRKQNDNVCWGIISIILSKNNDPKFKTAYQNTYHISDNNIICIINFSYNITFRHATL